MPKRLTRLKISEVSAVDSGAGRGVRVVLMKRDGKRRFTAAGELAGELVDKFDVIDQRTGEVAGTYSSRKKAKRERDRLNTAARGDRLTKVLAEIEDNRAVAKAAAPALEDATMYTDVQKAAAVAVVKRFNDRVEEVAQRDRIGYGAAMNKIAATSALVNREDAQLWADYRQASEVVKAATPAPEPAPAPTVSAAFGELQKRAAKLQKRDPKLSAASAFAKAYADPANRDLVEQDRAFHFAKAAGGLPDPNEVLVTTIMQIVGCSREEASGLALQVRAKRPPQALLYPKPAA